LILVLTFYIKEAPSVVQVTEITNEVNLMVQVWSPEMSVPVTQVQSFGRFLLIIGLNRSTFREGDRPIEELVPRQQHSPACPQQHPLAGYCRGLCQKASSLHIKRSLSVGLTPPLHQL
jgi:hypothetical protein